MTMITRLPPSAPPAPSRSVTPAAAARAAALKDAAPGPESRAQMPDGDLNPARVVTGAAPATNPSTLAAMSGLRRGG